MSYRLVNSWDHWQVNELIYRVNQFPCRQLMRCFELGCTWEETSGTVVRAKEEDSVVLSTSHATSRSVVHHLLWSVELSGCHWDHDVIIQCPCQVFMQWSIRFADIGSHVSQIGGTLQLQPKTNASSGGSGGLAVTDISLRGLRALSFLRNDSSQSPPHTGVNSGCKLPFPVVSSGLITDASRGSVKVLVFGGCRSVSCHTPLQPRPVYQGWLLVPPTMADLWRTVVCGDLRVAVLVRTDYSVVWCSIHLQTGTSVRNVILWLTHMLMMSVLLEWSVTRSSPHLRHSVDVQSVYSDLCEERMVLNIHTL